MEEGTKIDKAAHRIFETLETLQVAPEDALLVLTSVAASLICCASSSTESAERARNIMSNGILSIIRENERSPMSGWHTRVQ
jgi:hypothetical protein